MKVICVNDEFKPNEVPDTRWIKLGEEYEIERAYVFPFQLSIIGVKIKGIDNYDLAPYCYFNINRFQPTQETITEAIIEGNHLSIDDRNGALDIITTPNYDGVLAI